MLLPASTGSGESDLEIRRSAEVLTAVVSVAEFFFNDTATTEIYALSLHDALPICEESTLTTSVTVLKDPDVIVVRSQPTTPAGTLPPSLPETKPVPVWIASDRLTPVASEGPSLVTVSV